MADDLDIAADRAEFERVISLAAHARRMQTPTPLCEECAERHVHVTERGLRWRFCLPCAGERAR